MTAPPWPDANAALFLDFDGTLADIAPEPSAVRVLPTLVPLLRRLCGQLDGAVAVVSGRPADEIDGLLAPLMLPVAGVHGAQRRDALGRWHGSDAPPLDDAAQWLEQRCSAHPGLRVERKPGALALHYRGADELEDLAVRTMEELAAGLRSMGLLHGKKVIELKPSRFDKGRAVRAFLSEAPFRGRKPWCFGDDITDEAAFAEVLSRDGVAVKIGPGESTAAHRLQSPAALLDWLSLAAERLGEQQEAAPSQAASPTAGPGRS